MANLTLLEPASALEDCTLVEGTFLPSWPAGLLSGGRLARPGACLQRPPAGKLAKQQLAFPNLRARRFGLT